jgi:GT2 family glycosyltransferase
MAVTPLRLAITIATRDRRSELARTCAQLARLEPPADELLICADGCRDDTVVWVRTHVPRARLVVHAESCGSIRSRDELMRTTTADVVVGLDDDSYPLDLDFVLRVKTRFAARPRCAVLSFPQRTDEFPATLDQTTFGPPRLAGTYVNAASAIRRAAFLELDGWPLIFEHMGDEPDFALRCLAAGWEVLYDPQVVVRHHWSGAMRNERRNHHRHARNECWSILLRCPAPWWPIMVLRKAAGQFVYACRRGPGWAVREPVWWWQAWRGGPPPWRAPPALNLPP